MGFFSNSEETRELHKDGTLRTRYFRNSFDQCLKAIEKIGETYGYEIQQVNKQFGEVYGISNGFEVFFIIVELSPIETAIDIKVNYLTSIIGRNRPKKRIMEIYSLLNAKLTYKGVSLHP